MKLYKPKAYNRNLRYATSEYYSHNDSQFVITYVMKYCLFHNQLTIDVRRRISWNKTLCQIKLQHSHSRGHLFWTRLGDSRQKAVRKRTDLLIIILVVRSTSKFSSLFYVHFLVSFKLGEFSFYHLAVFPKWWRNSFYWPTPIEFLKGWESTGDWRIGDIIN